ncbi:MAG: hypothetical protein KA248_05265 [Kiritimatiellae bacterium]|nr:hypothetical protein [Kiritimatiellia bacterium]
MKLVTAAFLLIATLVPDSGAIPPLPSFRYYGLLTDEYGWPVTLDKDVEIVLDVDTNECARFTVNEQLGDGINYILEVPVDYAKSMRYASYAARTGDTAAISVYRGGEFQPLMNTSSVPVVGAAGDAVRLNLGMGTDEDHDGMSDLWETQLIIWNSGGQFSDISEVLPGDDFDGDGVPNIDEFNAGTAPELAGDVFQVYKWMWTADNLLAVRFLTVQGTTYEIKSAPAQVQGQGMQWTSTPFRVVSTGGDSNRYVATSSGWKYFYVEPREDMKLIRLEVVK